MYTVYFGLRLEHNVIQMGQWLHMDSPTYPMGLWAPMHHPTCPMVQWDGGSDGTMDSHGQSHLSHGTVG